MKLASTFVTRDSQTETVLEGEIHHDAIGVSPIVSAPHSPRSHHQQVFMLFARCDHKDGEKGSGTLQDMARPPYARAGERTTIAFPLLAGLARPRW